MTEPPGFKQSKGFDLEQADGTKGHVASVITEQWFEMPAPASVEELEFVLDVVVREYGSLAWRGQADIEWGLHSSMWRRLDELRKAVSSTRHIAEPWMQETEQRLLKRARAGGHDEEGSRQLADLELLGKMQQHGAATRLLDCTKDPLIATWFASREHSDNWGLLAGWDLRFVHEVTSSEVERPIPELIQRVGADAPLIWYPPPLTERIPAQQAVFLSSAVLETPRDRISIVTTGEQFWGTGNQPGVALIALSPELKDSAFAYLELSGLNEERLFPDFDGFAQSHGAQRAFPVGFWN
jgi:hypothetical protein